MNAQEAIEHAKKIIAQLKETQMMFIDKSSASQIKLFNNFQKDIDALEIALESAKYLHENSLIRGFEDGDGSLKVHVLHSVIYNEEDAKSIGIEVDANE